MKQIYRKENKYLLRTSEFVQLKKSLELVLQPDYNGKSGCYQVRSLYFDSLYDNDYYDNVDGVLEKRKIRLRVYPPRFEKVRLEWKCKEGSDGIKYDLWLTKEEARQMIRGDFSFLRCKMDALSQAIYVRLMCGAYRPKTLVQYEREAYGYGVSDVRITFDTYIKGTLTGYGLFDENPMFIPLLDYGYGILEIKYNDFLPDIIKRLTGKIDRLQIANSKYIQARDLM